MGWLRGALRNLFLGPKKVEDVATEMQFRVGGETRRLVRDLPDKPWRRVGILSDQAVPHKHGVNEWPSQVKERPAPPAPMSVGGMVKRNVAEALVMAQMTPPPDEAVQVSPRPTADTSELTHFAWRRGVGGRPSPCLEMERSFGGGELVGERVQISDYQRACIEPENLLAWMTQAYPCPEDRS